MQYPLTAPTVTIGIPFLNPGLLLYDAVRSIFAQTFEDWELLLVNDGSTDSSLALVKNIKDPRVVVVDDGTHQGLVPRLNQIIDMSTGKYIARMDADDLMHPRRLEKQIEYLETHEDVEVVDTGAFVLNRDREVVGIKGFEDNKALDVIEALKRGLVLHPSVMARSDWYFRNKYDPAFPRAEDRELFLRALRNDDVIAHIPEPLFFYFFEGNVRLDAFLLSYKSERKALIKHGPSLVGIPITFGLHLRSMAKSIALRCLVALGRDDIVTRGGYSPIADWQLQEARDALHIVYTQEVPGLNELNEQFYGRPAMRSGEGNV
mgnify:CR=1 FL=1